MSLVKEHGSGITIGSLQVLRPKADNREPAFASGPETLCEGSDAGVERGINAVAAQELIPLVLDPSQSLLYRNW